MNTLLSLMIMMSTIMLMLNHPLSMGLILIIQTLIVSLIIGYMMKSFFFSYIIIMIMLSGMLVLFIYMANVASNEKFKSPIKLMILSFIIINISILFLSMYNKLYYVNNLYMNETISLIKFFNMTTAQLTMIMIMYLLLTMIVVSNIAKVDKGPLRMKN